MRSYVQRLLAACPANERGRARMTSATPTITSAPPIPNPFVEPFTVREREMLRLPAEGASICAIAEQIIITLATVKKHVNNILGKLDAESRTQAILKARALDLL
jgi:LuxR family maltose regulon positive regulatory protein